MLFYAAYESVIGLAIGALVQHGNDAPVRERSAVADAIQSVGDNVIIGDPGIVASVGSLAWIVAVLAAAVAYRGLGAPLLATVLLGLSLVVVSDPPPIGPIGLVCFRRCRDSPGPQPTHVLATRSGTTGPHSDLGQSCPVQGRGRTGLTSATKPGRPRDGARYATSS